MKFSEQTTSQTLDLNNLKEITVQTKLNLVRKQVFQQAASWLLKTVVGWKSKFRTVGDRSGFESGATTCGSHKPHHLVYPKTHSEKYAAQMVQIIKSAISANHKYTPVLPCKVSYVPIVARIGTQSRLVLRMLGSRSINSNINAPIIPFHYNSYPGRYYYLKGKKKFGWTKLEVAVAKNTKV